MQLKRIDNNQHVKVFVYGTLRQGFGNHRLLEHPDVKFICKDSIRARMYTSHWGYPYIVFSQSNRDRVVGEVYEVHYGLVKSSLDRLEGYSPRNKNNLYNRKKALTSNKHTVYVYECGPYMRSSHCDWITHGDWVKAVQDRRMSKNDAFVPLSHAHPKWNEFLTKSE